MKKLIYIVLVIMLILGLSGCLSTPAETKSETRIKTGDDEVKTKTETRVTGSGPSQTFETTFETDEGKQTVKITGTEGKEGWCPVGGDWNMESTGLEGVETASWKVIGLETTGKYAGLCHVLYTSKSAEGDVKIDYWFEESGDRGYYEMDVGGQKIAQEFRG